MPRRGVIAHKKKNYYYIRNKTFVFVRPYFHLHYNDFERVTRIHALGLNVREEATKKLAEAKAGDSR